MAELRPDLPAMDQFLPVQNVAGDSASSPTIPSLPSCHITYGYLALHF